MNREQLVTFSINAARFADALLPVMEQYKITGDRACMFVAQLAHESAEFTRTVENLNYSAEGLRRTFARYFPDETIARQYHRQPEKIANRVYAGRIGNGAEGSGDGWRFRGRGLIQITGRENYRVCSIAIYGDDRLLTEPQLLEQASGACASAGWFWNSRDLNVLADAGRFEDVTRRINGGLNGLEDRKHLLARARTIAGIKPSGGSKGAI